MFWPWWWSLYRHHGKCHNPKHIKCLNPEVLLIETYCHCMCSSPVFPSIPFPAWGLGKAPLPSLLVLKCSHCEWEWVGDAVRSHSSLPAHAVPCRTPWHSSKERQEQGRGDLSPGAMGEVGRGDSGVFCPLRGEQKILMHSAVLC